MGEGGAGEREREWVRGREGESAGERERVGEGERDWGEGEI